MINNYSGSRLLYIYRNEYGHDKALVKIFFEEVFEEYRKYNDMMESYLEEEINKISINNTKILEAEISDKMHSEAENDLFLINSYASKIEATIFDMYYSNSFRASFLIQLYSFFEFELFEICTYYHSILKKNTPTDKKENIGDTQNISNNYQNNKIEKIDCAKRILQQCPTIKLGDISQWQYMDTIRKIRNRLVHHQGKISTGHKDWETIYKFVMEKKHRDNLILIPIDPFDDQSNECMITILNGNLNNTILNTVQSFFKVILDKLSIEHKL